MTNPLLNETGVPDFGALRAEHVVPAVGELLAQADAALQRAVSPEVPAEYDALSRVLDVAVERLGRAWGAVTHLNEVADTPALRSAHDECLPRVTDFYTRLGADEGLYAKYKAVPRAGLSPARTQALDHNLRDFVLGGAELQGAQRERFAQIQERSAELQNQFSQHVLDATDAFACYATEAQMAGVPADVLQATREAAIAEGRDGFKLTLHQPCYLPVMQYAHSRELRETMYRASVTRASELGDPALDNSALMTELLALRQEEAALLGYPHYAALSLVPKMAHSSEQVEAFLRDLAERARPHGQRDVAALREFAATELGLADLQAWDNAYASERLRQTRYAFSDQEVKQYFQLQTVLRGLFDIVEGLFDLHIQPDEAPVWHPSVRFFRIERGGRLLAQFYLDLHSRPGKRPGAWMDAAQQRWARPDRALLQHPVAHLVCNFAAPVGAQQALLTHDDLITLFHEFGHGLHHMLTQVDVLGVSGISGVEWDAVELPSQFMENFCWEWQVLQRLSAHVDTGAKLPRALFDKMVAARNFQSGMDMLRHVEYALFDLQVHLQSDAGRRLMQILGEVRQQVSVFPPPQFNRFPHAFSHIFAGGYAAGYYSYHWAEVLSADAWSAFEEAGVFDAETGQRYRQAILEAGGARDALESFRQFRGREPRIDALLRQRGMG